MHVKFMHKFLIPAILLASLFTVSGCSFLFTKSSSLDDMKDKNSILVFGYLDDSQAPFSLRSAQIRQVRPFTDKPFHEMRTDKNGMFYLENLPVGSYLINELDGPDKGLLSSNSWTWSLPSPEQHPEFKRTQFKATKPGLVYVGAYKIFKISAGGLFSYANYETTAINHPSEKELLKRLLEEAEGTSWEPIIKAKIRELK